MLRACPESFHPRAVVSVLDPNNEPVELAEGEAERDLEPVNGRVPLATEVVTRPMQPGSYHFVVRFEPNFGTAQADVLVAENRKAAAPDVVVENADAELLGCQQLDVSDGGQVLCLSPLGQMFARSGSVLGTLPGQAVRDGPVFWAYDSVGVSRWVEREDGGFLETGSRNLFGGSALLAPMQGGVLVATANGTLTRFFATDAGLDQETLSFGSLQSPEALWASGDDYIVWSPDRSCRRSGTREATCEPQLSLLPGAEEIAVGNEPEGLWFSIEDFLRPGSKSLVRIGRDGAPLRLDLPTGWPTNARLSGAPWGSSPTFVSPDAGLFICGARGDELVLQKFADAPFLSASSEWAAFRWADGGVALFRR